VMLLLVAAVIVVLLLGAVVYAAIWRKRPQQLKTLYYQQKWSELQKLLHDKTRWPEAILSADKLLETALKKRHVQGRTVGERLVKAQHLFTDNDSVWFGHKLRNRIDADPKTKLKETEVKQALLGIRRALKDVGALPNGKSTDSK